MEKLIEYYEFPNGEVVKRINSDEVYRFNKEQKAWRVDHSLTAEFAWDRPYGTPCEDLRRRIDISPELPPFPDKEQFFPGSTVFIGAYPQKTGYDFSPVSWLVLDVKDSYALCISELCLITSEYCNPHAPGRPEWMWWEHCSAREVCNNHFFDIAFSESEKKRIVPKEVSDVQFGKKCFDNVFLLSEREVVQYLPDQDSRKASPTSYAIQKGARTGWTDDTKNNACWWLLPEENAYGHNDGSIYPKAVFQTGEIQFHGRNVCHNDFTIRPCIKIKYKND